MINNSQGENKMIEQKIQTYPEFIASNCKKECSGCLQSLVDYLDNHISKDLTDYASLHIPERLLGQYHDLIFNQTVGERMR